MVFLVMYMKGTFGERVRYLREEMDISQTQLGEAIQATQRKISYIECGKYEPSVEDIVALCAFFNVSADYLLGIPQGGRYPIR